MKLKMNSITRIAMMTALLAICSWITIPFAVPFTMQTFAVFLALIICGGVEGSIAIAVYIALGAVGIPVFSGFSGGVSALIGPTGGYIFGFLLFEHLYRNKFELPLQHVHHESRHASVTICPRMDADQTEVCNKRQSIGC